MPDPATVWQALQGIGVLGILVICLWAVSKGAYITRDSHEALIGAQMALIAEMAAEIAKLESKIDRLESALAARSP